MKILRYFAEEEEKVVMDRDTRNSGFGFWKYRGEMSLRQVKQGFFHFLHIWWFFKVKQNIGAAKLCKIIE